VIEVISRPDGAKALIARIGSLFYASGGTQPVNASKDVAAVLNFPPGRVGEFKSITFLFLHSERISLRDVRRVIESVTFSKPALARTGSGSPRLAAVLAMLLLATGFCLRASARQAVAHATTAQKW
jgi:hypothetical protein